MDARSAEEQTFGVRSVASDEVGIGETSVAVKWGWFGGERAHAAVLVELHDRTLGVAVTTSRRPDPIIQGSLRAVSGDATRLAMAHDELVGPVIRAAVRQALAACRALSV